MRRDSMALTATALEPNSGEDELSFPLITTHLPLSIYAASFVIYHTCIRLYIRGKECKSVSAWKLLYDWVRRGQHCSVGPPTSIGLYTNEGVQSWTPTSKQNT